MADTAFPLSVDSDAALGGGKVGSDLRTGHAEVHDTAASAVRALEAYTANHVILPYIGTYASGTTYALGDAVRADNGGTWQLYISLVDSNLGNDPAASPSQWKDVVSDAIPVYVWGTVNPNTVGEQTGITEYDNGAPTGGTFDLGTATGIAWDANQAAVQAALDAEYGADTALVSGDALDVPFTVTYYGTPLVLDGTNLTGGGATSQTTTQAWIVGGFYASNGSVFYASEAGFEPVTFTWSDSVTAWANAIGIDEASSTNTSIVSGITALLNGVGSAGVVANISVSRIGGGSGNATANRIVYTSGAGVHGAQADDSVTNASEGTSDARGSKTTTRSGDGDGNAEAAFQVGRTGAGDGYAAASMFSERGGSGTGDSEATMTASVSGTAVGTATSGQTATHYTGGSMQVELSADSAGAYAKLIGTLPAAEAGTSNEIEVFTGDIAAFTTLLANGNVEILVRHI